MTGPVVVYDLDDTLYLERDYVASGFRAVDRWCAQELGLLGVGEHAWRAFEAGHRGDTLERGLYAAGFDDVDVWLPRVVEVYRRHKPTIRLCSDSARALHRTEGSHAILTDGFSETQRAKVTALGLEGVPTVVTDELGGPHCRKPAAAGFDAVSSMFAAAERSDFVYVADNPIKDLTGAVAAGWRAVRVRRSKGLHCSLEQIPAIDVPEVPDVAAALEIILTS